MGKTILEKPCAECPFMKGSLRGWLGGFTAEETYRAAVSEGEFQCHKTRGTESPAPCVGRFLFARKMGKMFRDADWNFIARRYVERLGVGTVFGYPEFFTWHNEQPEAAVVETTEETV